jgi:tryptophan 2,3-dioxygenase
MADIAEEFTTWKYRHLMATRRTIGNRSAYFGTPAVSWLLPTLQEIPFPELFSARAFIGDQPPVCPHTMRGFRRAIGSGHEEPSTRRG